MKKGRVLSRILTLALCLALLASPAAFAETADRDASGEQDEYAVIDPEALREMVENYAAAKRYIPEDLRIGYCYLDTGDTWYYNGDEWGADEGVNTVPLTMRLAEMESGGKLTRDSRIMDYTLGEIERRILIYSEADVIRQAEHYLGTSRERRESYQAYSPLPEEYYDPEFLDHGYISARFLTDVMKTLYLENERFPNVLECMKACGVNQYFNGAIGGTYEVAQQFGFSKEYANVAFQNCTGIIYTPHPFVLTVMTHNVWIDQELMRDMAILFKNYTLSLDKAYDDWSSAASAAVPVPEDSRRSDGENAVVDPAALQKLVEDYANAKGYDKGNLRIGYCYLDTGDTWFYNGDSWGMGAGVYYVPMMMLLAEWEHTGKLTRDSKIAGYTLGDAEYYILTESNSAIKNNILYGAFGSDREMREKMQAYSTLKEADYDSDYLDYCYLSPRFLLDVLKTLYYENERFPNILECMKARGVNDCFHGAMGGAYEVAQQFGAFEEARGTEYNNCMGIIYTPHPFALVVMTRNLGHTQEVMRDMAIVFKDYTLTLDAAMEN
ncbi:MAG: hypothetical protein IKH34_09900 [Oscillospiraceae bacterium]|nr:hypothetical protein [Oscillospiraceae bacterium]